MIIFSKYGLKHRSSGNKQNRKLTIWKPDEEISVDIPRLAPCQKATNIINNYYDNLPKDCLSLSYYQNYSN